MGRSYWFECSRCGYRAKVSGRPDRGVDFFVQTILCRDCKELRDVVTRMRWPAESRNGLSASCQASPLGLLNRARAPRSAPSFEAALNRLRATAAKRFRWINFPLQCPVSTTHRVQSWSEPDKCPRCGMYLEKHALPYRIWD